MARGALGEETYRRENIAFREGGRRLAGVRDASVLIETFDALERACGSDLPGDATSKLRARLNDERKQALVSLRANDTRVAAVVDEIDGARTRTHRGLDL